MPFLARRAVAAAQGFGLTSTNTFSFIATIASNTTSYNLASQATAAGWNGVAQLRANITINNGVVVSGTGNNTSSAIVINGLSEKSIITINNNGTVVGSGGSAGTKTSNSGAQSYPGNYAGSFVTPNYANNYAGTGYPTGPGAGGSSPGWNVFSGGTSPGAGSGTAGGSALYLASKVYLIINNGATGLFTGGGGGAGGQAGNNASGGSGANGGFCIEETGSHFIAIANNTAGGIISSGGGGSPGWGNRFEGDGVGGRPGNNGIIYVLSVANFGAVGISPGLATNNTGTSLINTAGQFTLSAAV